MNEPHPPSSPPSPTVIRDRIHDTLPVGNLWDDQSKQARHKKVGGDEIVIFDPSGRKFKVKVSEVVD
jgi:hypothetical protein